MISIDETEKNAHKYLAAAVNDPKAKFRDGQWEAIDAVVTHRKKLIVVQRTGWGKSSVYFISTRILRDRGAGPTIIISPLLALMRNQIEAAERLGLRATTINSTNKKQWSSIIQQIRSNQIDVFLISPERLAKEDFIRNVLTPIAEVIGLLVVDEAHCIADWGNDFRPDYRRIVNILKQMPPNMPVLGTTATANERVINDIQSQLGNVQIQRGTLIRESLHLQNIQLPDQASRLAWLATNIPNLAGTGIVYVLTQRDSEQVAKWLVEKGIDAKAYHSGVEHQDFDDKDSYRQYLETLLLNNEIKVLVATTALGMGYDKPDLGFVIHYQVPGSIVGYYQQVGRAGRGISNAYGILLAGAEDKNIHQFFRENAFPSEKDVNAILTILDENDGLKIAEIEKRLNLSRENIRDVLKFLSAETYAPVIEQDSKWSRTLNEYRLDQDRIEHITHQRELEWQEIINYVEAQTCLMSFLRSALDEVNPEPCGKCVNCIDATLFSPEVSQSLIIKAQHFLKHTEITKKPREKLATGAFKINGIGYSIPLEHQSQEARILSRWGDAGWGSIVAYDKRAGRFRSDLIDAAAEMYLERWKPMPSPEWVTCVPSNNNPNLVPNFAMDLASRLCLPFIDAVAKIRDNEPQKNQTNTFHQCKNLDGVFEIRGDIPQSSVLLVDDVIDSGLTVAVVAILLQRAGSGPVFPFALATSAKASKT